MTITIHELDEQNISDVNRCDGAFMVDSRLVLQVENNVIAYTTVRVPSFQKCYEPEQIDYSTYLGNPDRAIFFAYDESQLAGQIILRKNWNRLAYVEDIAVDVHFRRRGVGRALMQSAVDWAKGKGLAGIMLETQDNNVAACRFYERCGFELAGFDRYLYKGINMDTEEIALYWYLLF